MDACLQLLSPGEALMYPDFAVPQEVVDEVTAAMGAAAHQPSCKICHNLARRGKRLPTLWLPRNVDVLAHHMQTK